MCWNNVNGNGKKASKFICLKCLDWRTTYTQDIQRKNQREIDHIKTSGCIRCGDVDTMEVRYCDYLPDIMKKAMKKHNELYNDSIREIVIEHYGAISI